MGGYGLFRKPTIENITASGTLSGGGAVVSEPLKYALAIGGGVVAGFMFHSGTQQTQQQQQQAQAQTGGYKIIALPGSEVTLKGTTTGNANVDQAQDQDAKAESPNYMQWLLIGGLALAGLYIWKKVR